MLFGYIIFLFVLIVFIYRIWFTNKPFSAESNEIIISGLQKEFNAQYSQVSLTKFDCFKSLNNGKIIKSLEIIKSSIKFNVVFIEYKYIVKNRNRYSPSDDTSTYAFYLIETRNFNIGYLDTIDTKEIKDDYILIRLDYAPIEKKKTSYEINQILNSLITYSE